jgi:hypothetical protein
MKEFDYMGALALMLIFGPILAAVVGGIFIKVLKILRGIPPQQSKQLRAEETKLMQEIYQGLSWMQERVEVSDGSQRGGQRNQDDRRSRAGADSARRWGGTPTTDCVGFVGIWHALLRPPHLSQTAWSQRPGRWGVVCHLFPHHDAGSSWRRVCAGSLRAQRLAGSMVSGLCGRHGKGFNPGAFALLVPENSTERPEKI